MGTIIDLSKVMAGATWEEARTNLPEITTDMREKARQLEAERKQAQEDWETRTAGITELEIYGIAFPVEQWSCRFYVIGREVSKLIKKVLKKAYPGITFSVRYSSYAGGSSIDIYWTDGPPEKMVDRLVGIFEGATFDGMRDLKESVDSEVDSYPVHFGVDFISCVRTFSPESNAYLLQHINNKYAFRNDWQGRVDRDHRFNEVRGRLCVDSKGNRFFLKEG